MGIIENGTVSGTLPSSEAFAVHYPGYPSSVARAVETLGGAEGILKVRVHAQLNLTQPNRLFELISILVLKIDIACRPVVRNRTSWSSGSAPRTRILIRCSGSSVLATTCCWKYLRGSPVVMMAKFVLTSLLVSLRLITSKEWRTTSTLCLSMRMLPSEGKREIGPKWRIHILVKCSLPLHVSTYCVWSSHF